MSCDDATNGGLIPGLFTAKTRDSAAAVEVARVRPFGAVAAESSVGLLQLRRGWADVMFAARVVIRLIIGPVVRCRCRFVLRRSIQISQNG